MKVIAELPPAAGKVIVLPTACPVPPLTSVIVGVDEPSVTTLIFVPVPEPFEPDWSRSYVPGVPPVPPDIVSKETISFEVACCNA